MKSSTALLLFSRSAKAEAVGKKIFVSSGKNKKATSSLVENALQLAVNCGLNWYLSDETSQQGNNFGENLVNAITGIFNQGYKKVIVIGNDCPELNQKKLQNAIAQLQQHDLVLGPNNNGGVYLLGLTADSFNENAFKKICWQTDKVFEQLLKNIKETNACFSCLRVLDDINCEADVSSLKKKLNHLNNLTQFLIHLLRSAFFHHSIVFEKIISSCHVYSFNKRRGPPANYCLLKNYN